LFLFCLFLFLFAAPNDIDHYCYVA
jgi:hypothetical protein